MNLIELHKRRWRSLLLAQFLALATAFAAFALLSLSGWFIAATGVAGLTVATAQIFDYLRPAAGIRSFALVRTGARYFERLAGHDATLRILADLRLAVFQALLPQTPDKLGLVARGEVLSRLTGDIDIINAAFLRMISPAVTAAVLVVLACGFIAFFDPAAALLLLGIALIIGGALSLAAGRQSRRYGPQLAEGEAAVRGAAVDLVAAMADLRAFGADGRAAAAIEAEAGDWYRDQRAQMRGMAVTEALTIVFAGGGIVGGLWLGLTAFEAGGVSGPVAAMIAFAAMALFESVGGLPLAMHDYGRVNAAARRIEALAAPGSAAARPAPQLVGKAGGEDPVIDRLRFDKVGFTYPERAGMVLDGLSFELRRGETLALIGPSGIGKSTVADLIVRFYEPTAGSILIGGHRSTQWPPERLRRRIAYLPQYAHLFSATVRDNLAMGSADAEEPALWRVLDIVEMRAAVEALPDGLDHWIGEGGYGLSGGEARRLALARTLLKPADLVILDEPTANIDPAHRARLMQKLVEPAPDSLRIIITHEPHLLPARPDIQRLVLAEAGLRADLPESA